MTQQHHTKNKLIVIAGPTATGKTKTAIELAEKVNGELINADSVQFYKYLNIGANKGKIKKITSEKIVDRELPIVNIDESKIPAHLFDFLDLDEEFTIAHFYRYLLAVLKNIWSSNKQPILVGGSGLYIDTILKGYNLNLDAEQSTQVDKNLEELVVEIKKLDSNLYNSLNNSDKNNPRRLVRLIEKIKNKEIGMKNMEIGFDIQIFYPIFNREELYKRINMRVLQMFEEGFVDEVKNILEMGYDRNIKALKSAGYKDVVRYLYREISYEECIRLVQKSHRNYAKRQITWFEGAGRGYELTRYDSNVIPSRLT